MTRPRAADDFATIRARLEELRRERERATKESCEPADAASGGRGLLRAGDGRQRSEQERWPAVSSSRRYGSGR